LNNVDFPTFGSPTIPALSILSFSGGLRRSQNVSPKGGDLAASGK